MSRPTRGGGPAADRYDEDDVRIRPGRRGTRPRTKRRPTHDHAETAFVVSVDRGRYGVVLEDETRIVAMRARELGRKAIAVGDEVAVVGDTSGVTDALARIVRIEPRSSVLRRTADDTDTTERVVVANADQLGIVMSVADPVPQPRFIDRCLVAAIDAGITPLLIITKGDLAAPDALVEAYAELVPRYIAVSRPPEGRPWDLDAVHAALAGHTTAFIGPSGVGKSTLVNALVTDADRATSEISGSTGKGRHTSTSAVALRLDDDSGWIIDTPGIRSFGLAHVDADAVVAAFGDLAAGTGDCPRACDHRNPDCALDAFVAGGGSTPARLDSLRRLLIALAQVPDWA